MIITVITTLHYCAEVSELQGSTMTSKVKANSNGSNNRLIMK